MIIYKIFFIRWFCSGRHIIFVKKHSFFLHHRSGSVLCIHSFLCYLNDGFFYSCAWSVPLTSSHIICEMDGTRRKKKYGNVLFISYLSVHPKLVQKKRKETKREKKTASGKKSIYFYYFQNGFLMNFLKSHISRKRVLSFHFEIQIRNCFTRRKNFVRLFSGPCDVRWSHAQSRMPNHQ